MKASCTAQGRCGSATLRCPGKPLKQVLWATWGPMKATLVWIGRGEESKSRG
jgi:hypothetical protein